MQLINEDDVLRVLNQLAHDLFQALFKLSPVFGAGYDQREIERKDSFVLEERRHITANDSLSKPFDDRGLAYAGLANQHRIVLSAAAKYLHYALNLRLATDQRIKFVV